MAGTLCAGEKEQAVQKSQDQTLKSLQDGPESYSLALGEAENTQKGSEQDSDRMHLVRCYNLDLECPRGPHVEGLVLSP